MKDIKKCIVDGCRHKARAYGTSYCETHYQTFLGLLDSLRSRSATPAYPTIAWAARDHEGGDPYSVDRMQVV